MDSNRWPLLTEPQSLPGIFMLVCPYSMIRFEFVEGQEPLLIFVILTSARFESVVNLLKADLKIPHIMTLES